MILGFILGAIIAYSTTKSTFIACLGGIAGYFLFKRMIPLATPIPITNKHEVDNAFFNAIFPLLGVIAKADGQVSKSEISSAEQLFNAMNLNADNRKKAIELFQRGAKGEIRVEDVVSDFLKVCQPYKDLKQLLIVYLMTMAFADGVLDKAEENALESIAKQLGYSSFVFNQLLGMVKAQHAFEKNRRSQSQSDNLANLDQAYIALGVEKSATDKELKTAYRKLMSQYHPDKLAGQGVPDHVIEVATEKSQEIQSAYEMIKKSRNN